MGDIEGFIGRHPELVKGEGGEEGEEG